MTRVAVITGAAGGIGCATVKLFRSMGWYVVGVDVHELDSSDRSICVDLSDANQSARAFKSIMKTEGRIDALVNNAASQLCKSILETTSEDWNAVIACNLSAVFYATRNAHPLLKKVAGSIVNVSSVHALATSPNISAYAASKGGVTAFTRAAALEFAADNIRVNAVLPGATQTKMLLSGLARNHLSAEGEGSALVELSRRHPLKRVGQPAEIAEAIMFLADGEKSAFITGQSIVVDGGVLAKLSSE